MRWAKLLTVLGSVSLMAIILTGCGGSSGSGSRGNLSEVISEKDEGNESRAGDDGRRRGEGRTRTRTDHTEQSEEEAEESTPRYYYEEDNQGTEDDDGFRVDGLSTDSVVSWIFSAIFSGGEDDDEGSGAGQASAANDSVGLGRFSVGYRYSWSDMAGDAVSGFETSTYMIGVGPKDGFMGYLGFYTGKGRSVRGDLDQNISDLGEAGLELGFRAYFTPDHTLLGSYFKFGARLGEISWSYRDPPLVPSEDGGMALIYDDGVLEGGPFIGLGVSVLQTRYLHIGASAQAGIRFTNGKTFEQYENDIFKDVGFIQWNLEGSIRF